MSRSALAALAVALPAVAAVVSLTVAGATRPAAVPATFADAITMTAGVEEVYAFIHGGADPNQPIHVKEGDLPGLAAGAFAPLVVAVSAGDGNVVRMLLDYTEPGPAALHDAHCLALRLGDASSAAAIARRRSSPPDCPSR